MGEEVYPLPRRGFLPASYTGFPMLF